MLLQLAAFFWTKVSVTIYTKACCTSAEGEEAGAGMISEELEAMVGR